MQTEILAANSDWGVFKVQRQGPVQEEGGSVIISPSNSSIVAILHGLFNVFCPLA